VTALAVVIGIPCLQRRDALKAGVVLVLLAASAASLVACAKVALTESLRRRYALGPADVKQLQFYTSDEIILRRELSDQVKETEGYGLVIKDDVRVEDVVIPRGTPAVALRVEGDFILASFSRRSPDQALWFGLRRPEDDGGIPSTDRRYELAQLENPLSEPGPFKPIYSKSFVVSYGGKRYRLADPRMWDVFLLCDLDESFAKNRVKVEPPGWKLSEGAPSGGLAPPSADGGPDAFVPQAQPPIPSPRGVSDGGTP
jgi:hypothetical protein